MFCQRFHPLTGHLQDLVTFQGAEVGVAAFLASGALQGIFQPATLLGLPASAVSPALGPQDVTVLRFPRAVYPGFHGLAPDAVVPVTGVT